MTFNHRSFKRKQLAACIIGITYTVIVVIDNTLQLIGVTESYNYALKPYPFESNFGTNLIQSLCFLYCTLVATFPLFYIMVISLFLKENFKGFNKLLESKIHDGSCRIPDIIQDLREFHLRLCEVNSLFDKDFKYLFGNTVVFNIGNSLFILYIVLKDDHVTNTDTGYLIWFVMLMTSLIFISLCAAMVNEEVRSHRFYFF